MLCQDALEARVGTNKVSLHPITTVGGPLYHAGVETIDAFCYSLHRKPTEDDLDEVYECFLVKEGVKSAPAK